MTRPEVAVRMQPRMESSVVFPEPDGPSSETISPRSSESETPLRTDKIPSPSLKSLVTFCALNTVTACSELHSWHGLPARVSLKHGLVAHATLCINVFSATHEIRLPGRSSRPS